MDGWFKLHRKLLKNPIVMKDAAHLAIWVWLLGHAAHDETDVVFHGKRYTLKPGELVFTQRIIANDLSLSREKVKRVLNDFKNEQQIDQRSDRQKTLVSIVRWTDYQINDQRNDQRVTNDRPTSDQQNKNIRNKEYKNLNIYAQNEPQNDINFASFWSAYPRKVGKGAAKKAWDKIKPDLALTEKMVEAVENAKKTSQWKKDNGQFIPYPATWLNQERWNDEYIPDDTIDIFKDL